MLPFISRQTADQILEQHEQDEIQRSEILAEIGSSYVFGGGAPEDAMFFAGMYLSEGEREWRESEAGRAFAEKLEAATFMRTAIAPDMRLRNVVDSSYRDGIYYAGPTIPEFIPGLPNEFFTRSMTPANDDIPF